MTRDDIIRMAQESGMAEVLSKYDGEYGHDASKETEGFAELERFAAFVAAAERKACAKACDQLSWKLNDDITRAAFTMAADTIRARNGA